jgi:hypothetical protein
LKLPGLACFRIDFASRIIEVISEPASTLETLSHLLLDQVIPRVLCHTGRVVVHASAVLLEDGRAVAFTGTSGRGKSTLASAFSREGFPVIADDCLLLQSGDGTDGVVQAFASYPSLRLWPDSSEALWDTGDPASPRISDMAHYSNKKQVFLAGERQQELASPSPLAALYLLNKPPDAGPEPGIRIKPAGGTAAIMAMIEALFALDVVRKDLVQRNFEQAAQVAGQTEVYDLSYPRYFNELPDVVATVVQHTRKISRI